MLKFTGLRFTNHQGRRIQVAVLEEFGKVRLMSKGVVAQQIRELLAALTALQEEKDGRAEDAEAGVVGSANDPTSTGTST